MKNKLVDLFFHPLIQQLMRFGIVGLSAAIVNFVIVVALVQEHLATPLIANILAFLLAFFVSFYGHHLWTFKSNAAHKVSMPKFFLVAASSFLLYEGLFAVFLRGFHLFYMLALGLTLVIVPPFTFVLSKLWAFST